MGAREQAPSLRWQGVQLVVGVHHHAFAVRIRDSKILPIWRTALRVVPMPLSKTCAWCWCARPFQLYIPPTSMRPGPLGVESSSPQRQSSPARRINRHIYAALLFVNHLFTF